MTTKKTYIVFIIAFLATHLLISGMDATRVYAHLTNQKTLDDPTRHLYKKTTDECNRHVHYEWLVINVSDNPDGHPRNVIAVYDMNDVNFILHQQHYNLHDVNMVDINDWLHENLDLLSSLRSFPGPLINVTIGDCVHVKIHNNLLDQRISIHFHGLHMRDNVWMDGAQLVTECGIPPATHYEYVFQVTQTGTYWYHSHANGQYGDGLFGPLVSNDQFIDDDPIYKRFPYKNDQVIMIQDWYHDESITLMNMMMSPRVDDTNDRLSSDHQFHVQTHENDSMTLITGNGPRYPWPPASLLINGIGEYDCNRINMMINTSDPLSNYHANRMPIYGACQTFKNNYNPDEQMKTTWIHQKSSHQYTCDGDYMRLRIINTGVNMPLRFWIEKQRFWIVARDGNIMDPVQDIILSIHVGQRIDIIISCNEIVNQNTQNTPVITYMHIMPEWQWLLPQDYQNPQIMALRMQYPIYAPTPTLSSVTKYKNIHLSRAFDECVRFWHPKQRQYCFELEIKSNIVKKQDADNVWSMPAHKQIILFYDRIINRHANQLMETWRVNQTSLKLSNQVPLHYIMWDTQRISDYVINNTKMIHLEHQSRYQVVLVSQDMAQIHPWHLHGHTVEIVQIQSLCDTLYNENVHTIDSSYSCYNSCESENHLSTLESYAFDYKNITCDWSLQNIIIPHNQTMRTLMVTDTFIVPPHTMVVFRFSANNPGPWLFHCHIHWHFMMGMGIIFSVQYQDTYASILTQPDNSILQTMFTCGTMATHARLRYLTHTETPVLPFIPSTAIPSMHMNKFQFTLGLIFAFIIGTICGMFIMCAWHIKCIRNILLCRCCPPHSSCNDENDLLHTFNTQDNMYFKRVDSQETLTSPNMTHSEEILYDNALTVGLSSCETPLIGSPHDDV